MPISLSSPLATTYATIAASRPARPRSSRNVSSRTLAIFPVAAPIAPVESLDPDRSDEAVVRPTLSRMSRARIAMRGRDSVVKLMWRREWMRE
jgi:hypothetical protein